MSERLAPEAVLVTRDGVATMEPVTRTVAHPPGTCPDAPIRAGYWVLELQTACGSRWYGFERAPWIGSDLRMHVLLDTDRDEVRNGWETPANGKGKGNAQAVRD